MAKGKYTNIAASTFSAAAGGLGAMVMYMLVSLAFLVPGFMVVTRELNKDKKDRKTPMLVLGFGLAFVGVAVGFGMGAGAIFEMLGDSMSE
jgi:hypothetical protein